MKLELPYPPGVNTLYGVRAVIKREPLVELLIDVRRGLDVHEAATRAQRLAAAFPFKTREHEAYATHARLAMYECGFRADQLPRWPRPAELGLTVRLYRPRRAGDIDGPLKTLLDSLQGNLFENDDQVAQLEVQRLEDKHRPRVELEARELAAEQPDFFHDDGVATGGAARPGFSAGKQPPDARGTGPARTPATPPVAARVVLPEPLERRLRRLARPAVVHPRNDEPPEAA